MSGHRVSTAGVVMILTAAGAIAGASRAEAALYYWNDFDPGYYRPAQPQQPRKPKVRRNAIDKKTQAAERETGAKPQGPLVISIAIDQQKIRVYDSNGLFAEGPVSTGMKGHPTPMGVFSIIQKHRMHHSNIYSGAPMPYMQRITWSGVAMHQGVLPGYPASHGCIRMPAAFAIKMWNWTKIGARVLVTPGDVTPARFSHPFLVTKKVVPQPVADEAPTVDTPLGVKSDKGADAAHQIGRPNETADTKLELRSTVGHARTAAASGVVPVNAAVTMSDASPAAGSGKVETAKAEEPKAEEAKPETAATSGDKTAETKPAEVAASEVKSSRTSVSANTNKAVEPKAEARPANVEAETAQEAAPRADAVKTEEKAAEKAAEPAEPAKAATDTTAADAPAKKDTSRLPGLEKPRPELKREGPIAIFISRKDGKLYVRQNFKPVFDVPVTIAPGDKLLGTHVFTAEVDKSDSNVLRWSVVSLPVTARNAQRSDEDERPTRRRKVAGAVPAETRPAPAPNTPAEALDRITVLPETMARIAEALSTGSSIMVSDQGINQGETGEGTDFIVRLR